MYKDIQNVLELIKIFNRVNIVKAYELANLLNFSERTIHRYIDELCIAGFPICSIRGRYHGGFYLSDIKSRTTILSKKKA